MGVVDRKVQERLANVEVDSTQVYIKFHLCALSPTCLLKICFSYESCRFSATPDLFTVGDLLSLPLWLCDKAMFLQVQVPSLTQEI